MKMRCELKKMFVKILVDLTPIIFPFLRTEW